MKKETLDFKVAFKREANVAKEAVAGAAAKIRCQKVGLTRI